MKFYTFARWPDARSITLNLELIESFERKRWIKKQKKESADHAPNAIGPPIRIVMRSGEEHLVILGMDGVRYALKLAGLWIAVKEPDLSDTGPYATAEDADIVKASGGTILALRRSRYEDDLKGAG